MKKWSLLLFSLSLTINTAYAADFLVVEGRLTDSLGLVPETSSSVDFTLDVLSDDGNNCVLYSESHNSVDMSNSDGYFSLRLGQGSVNSGTYATSLDNNSGMLTGLSCDAGTTYNPGVNSHRSLRISYDNGGGVQTLSQLIDIGSSRYAVNAGSVGGLTAADILPLSGGTMTGPIDMGAQNITSSYTPTGANDLTNKNYVDAAIAAIPNASTKLDMTGGSLTGAIDIAGSADAVQFSVQANATQSTNINMLEMKDSGGTVVASVQADGSISNPTDLVTNSHLSASLSSATSLYLPLAGGTMSGSIAMGTNNITSSYTPIAADDLTNKSYVDSEISTATATMGDFMADGTVAMTGALDMGTQDIININNVTATGSIVANGLSSGTNLALYNGTDYIGFQAPAGAANIVFTLPINDGSPGQVLQTDGSLGLSWVTPGNGTVNNAANVGSGVGQLFRDTVSGTINIKSIDAASTKLSVVNNANDISLDVVDANIDHDVLTGYVANEHIDHSTVSINTLANSGLSGGGNLTATRSLSVNINGTPAEAAVVNTDEFLMYDTSATALRKVTYANLMAGSISNGGNTGAVSIGSTDNTTTVSGAVNLQLHGGNNVYIRSDSTGGGGDIIFEEGAAPTELMRISENGNVGIGVSSPQSTLDIVDDTNPATIRLTSATSAPNDAPKYKTRRAGGSPGSPAQVQSGDVLMALVAEGYTDVASYSPGAQIKMIAEENFSSTANGTSMSFHTASLGGGAPQKRMTITPNGDVGIGVGFPSVMLEVGGDTMINGNTTISSDLQVTGRATANVVVSQSLYQATGNTFDFSQASTITTGLNCDAFTLNNLSPGGEYSLLINGTAMTSCSFQIFTGSGVGNTNLVFKSGHGTMPGSVRRLYKFKVINAGGADPDVFITWEDF